jgi:nicotinamide riboside transporter PnuC
MELFYKASWVVSILALLGTVLNIYKKQACFVLWTVTNFYFCIYDFCIGATAQSALFAVYFILALWGLWKWE